MKASELRQMSDEQLVLTLNETSEGLFRKRLQSQTEKLSSPSDLKKARQLIARILTVQTERKLAQV
jgi:large subunit ribosomal protein L29